eukprot:1161786-Pelagomonas_calceolata.AAC.6
MISFAVGRLTGDLLYSNLFPTAGYQAREKKGKIAKAAELRCCQLSTGSALVLRWTVDRLIVDQPTRQPWKLPGCAVRPA